MTFFLLVNDNLLYLLQSWNEISQRTTKYNFIEHDPSGNDRRRIINVGRSTKIIFTLDSLHQAETLFFLHSEFRRHRDIAWHMLRNSRRITENRLSCHTSFAKCTLPGTVSSRSNYQFCQKRQLLLSGEIGQNKEKKVGGTSEAE